MSETVTLTTRTTFPFVIVEYDRHVSRPFIRGYAATEAAAAPRARKRGGVVGRVEAGKVTVEVHACTRCGKDGGVRRFSGPGGICLDCELAARS
jgi:hypothetical protein